MAVHRAPQTSGRWRKLLLIGVPPVVLLVGAAVLFIAEPQEPSIPLDEALCQLGEAPPARAVLLLDLRKPLGNQAAALAEGALTEVTSRLAAHTELAVFALTANAGAPRQPIRRFCKPYANEAISPGSAKDGRVETRDCDNLPAQLAAQTRANATRFCALRDQAAGDVARLAARPLAVPVPNAYLVEAIEETSLAYAEQSGAKALYVFSDMLQHADWFSHVERGSQGWGFNDFIHMREVAEASAGPRPPPLEGVEVTVFYIPREGVTDAPRSKMNLTEFWRLYFRDALGADPVFSELAPMASYPVEPLLNKLTRAEALAQERQRLEAEAKRLERATAEYQAAQERARQERRRAEAAQRAARQQALADAAQQPPPQETSPPAAAEQEAEAASAPAQTDSPAARQATAATPADEDAAPAAEPAELAQSEAAPADAPTQPPPTEPEPPPPASPEPALAGASGANTDGAPNDPQENVCQATLQPRFQNTNAYPIKNRRLNLGSANIAVEFVLDEQGETEDDTVRVIADSSIASRPSYFDAFADEAQKLVRDWVFDFGPTNPSDPCAKRQTLRARVEFKY